MSEKIHRAEVGLIMRREDSRFYLNHLNRVPPELEKLLDEDRMSNITSLGMLTHPEEFAAWALFKMDPTRTMEPITAVAKLIYTEDEVGLVLLRFN